MRIRDREAPVFICRSKVNPKLILCTNGDWMSENLVGPGGYAAKVYKTRKGAERVRDGNVIVEEVRS